jgi:aspartate/tyrosine/aromatic aminotransferase
MFSYTGLSAAQVKVIIDKHHVYMFENGRISLAGLTGARVPYLARAIHDVVTTVEPIYSSL